MKIPHCACIALALVLALSGGVARAQVAPGGNLLNTIKTDPAVDKNRPVIQNFIQANISWLKDPDGDKQSKAREALIQGSVASGAGADPAYQLEYGQQLVNPLIEVIRGTKDQHIRLNAAIVTAKVADYTQNSALLRVVEELLPSPKTSDNVNSEAVVLWATKAARSIMPYVIAGGNTSLLDRVVYVAKTQQSGLITEEAYLALTPTLTGIPPQVLAAIVKPLLELYAWRIEQYKKDGVPDEPSADRIPAFFLTQSGVWKTLTKADASRTSQLIAEALWLSTQHVLDPAMGANERVQLKVLIGATAKAVQARALDWTPAPAVSPLQTAAQAVSSFNATTPQNAVQKQVEDLLVAMYGTQQFGGFRQPTKLAGPNGIAAPMPPVVGIAPPAPPLALPAPAAGIGATSASQSPR